MESKCYSKIIQIKDRRDSVLTIFNNERDNMIQYVVMMALAFSDENPSRDMIPIDDFFNERDWGTLHYVMQWKTLPGHGGEGGRSDVLFKWKGTPQQLQKLAVQRFRMGPDAPRWLEDYVDNNKDIIPPDVLPKLQAMRMW